MAESKIPTALSAVVITYSSRLGAVIKWYPDSFLYVDNSNFLGSININLTSSGLALYKIEIIIVLIHTDLPAPVAPATSRWGSFPKSIVNASPIVVLPIAIVNLDDSLI